MPLVLSRGVSSGTLRAWLLAVLASLALACDPPAGGTTSRGGGGHEPTPAPDDAGASGDAGSTAPPSPGPGTDAGSPDGPGPTPEPDAGSPPPGSDDGLGECTGTEAECLAARLINEYRARHVNEGECNHPLRWDPELGRLAHEHQSGPFVRHSSHGYIENVGNEFSVEGAVEWILEFTPGVEEHCRSDGSYVASHHCAGMFCNNYTVGVGVYEGGDRIYMTMMFGDEDGQPSW